MVSVSLPIIAWMFASIAILKLARTVSLFFEVRNLYNRSNIRLRVKLVSFFDDGSDFFVRTNEED